MNKLLYIVGGVIVLILIIVIAGSDGEEKKETTPGQQSSQEQSQPEQTSQEEQKESTEEPTTKNQQEQQSVQEPKQEPTQEQRQETAQEPEPINLSGTSQQASQKFTLESGLSIFRMTHVGTSNFIIWLLDNTGEEVELLVNETDNFDGAKAVGIETNGTYILDVSADGQWTVKIEQPRPITAPSIPQTFTGTGQQVSEFVTIPRGLTTFRITHSGSSNFIIWLLNDDGETIELLVNETGSFNGSKAVGIEQTGIYLLDIAADGNWSVAIE